MNKATKLVSLIGTVVLLGGLTVGSVQAANPAVTCGKVYVDATGAAVSCGGTGQYRIVYSCPNVFKWEKFWVKYGPWVNASSSSRFDTGTTCNVYWNRPYASVATR